MSIVLRRPMFRGGRVRKSNGGVMDIYEQISEKIPMPERRQPRALSTGDYLRIASAGLDIPVSYTHLTLPTNREV